jgi:DNA-binding GntR family transcriptional regulator
MFNKMSLSEQVEDALRQEITEGRVLPGQRVSIADYQESWNISSTPFRDAVRALEIQGFVTVEPRKGVYVAPMNRETVNEIFELRIALECMAIELATLRVPLDKAEEVRDAYSQNEEHAVDSSELVNKDRLVHDLARDYCGNRRLQRLLTSHLDLIRWAQNTVIIKIPGSYELALPEHLAIMNAVCDRDGKGAALAMRTHLENSRARLEAGLSAGKTTPMS